MRPCNDGLLRLLHPRLSCRVSLAIFIALIASGCGSLQHGGDPQATLHAYAHALDQGRADEAYGYLSDDARRGISLDAFRRTVKDDPEGVAEIGRSLERATAPALVTATITSSGGQELHLVLEKGQWRVDASTIDLYAQDTPRHAIIGFVRAIERQRYDLVMRYVPDAHRAGLDAAKLRAAWEGRDKDDIAQVIAALKHALPAGPIEETGGRAAMQYGASSIQLVREAGLWKIENFD
jgi:hypothetical protein